MSETLTLTLYQVDTGYACAGIIVTKGRITVTAPILRRWKGRLLKDLPKNWKVTRVGQDWQITHVAHLTLGDTGGTSCQAALMR